MTDARRERRTLIRRHDRGWRGPLLVVPAVVSLVLLAGGLVANSPQAQAATKTTNVILTFDDGNANQMAALPILAKYGMHGTFYIISGTVGAPNYFTLANLQTIAAAGNEIAGHTVTHPDLTTVPADEAKRQICNGRVALANMGFQTTDFAYPYAAANASVESIVKQCGFDTARGLGDIASTQGCAGCGTVETNPPADPYYLKALDEDDTTWTLTEMENEVTAAEKTGGNLMFTFHNICATTTAGCDPVLSTDPARFDAFLSWVSQRKSLGTTVKTVHQAFGGLVKPLVTAPAATNTTVANPSLEASTSGDGFPDCYMPGGFGTNTPTWTRTTDAHSGTYAEQLTVTGYSNGDAKLLPTFDLGACTPTIKPGGVYTIGVWYKSTAITQFALYYRNASGFWQYWTSGPWLAAASTWTQGTFTTPAAPSDAAGMSFGMALIANGSVTTDDYSFAVAGAPASTGTTVRSGPIIAGPRLLPAIVGAAVNKGLGVHAKPSIPRVPGQHIAAPEFGD